MGKCELFYLGTWRRGSILFLFFYFCLLCLYRFESVYLDDEIRVVKDIRGDYLVVDRAPYTWTE